MAGLLALFLQFLSLGLRAWGGPVAQIALMHEELVVRRRWADEPTFRRVLGVYQVLPGPEATEMAIYFGMLRGGRLGGLLAGLGFILPGFLLTLAAAVAYVRYGDTLPGAKGLFYAAPAAVMALILFALLRLARLAFTTRGLLLTGVATFFAALLTGYNVVLIALLGGAAYFGLTRAARPVRIAPAIGLLAAFTAPFPVLFAAVFLLGGAVTFGGAYTVIPFLEQALVHEQAWISQESFLEALAVSGLLPAPLIMVAAFLGHLIAPPWGGPVATAMIFLPAFLLTLLFHAPLMRLVGDDRVRGLLDGMTAAVVGLIGATLVSLAPAAFPDGLTVLVAVSCFVALWAWRANPALVVLLTMAAGVVLEAVGFVA